MKEALQKDFQACTSIIVISEKEDIDLLLL
jgi:hypothetical protein